MDVETLIDGRQRLLRTALAHFKADPDVSGVFLGGSLAAKRADAYSDIDLRVVVTSASHARFVANRRRIPAGWPGFLFNEWMPGAQHCVSHFRPFCKIDIFYLDQTALRPSPWYGLPIEVLHDPHGVVAALIAGSRDLPFTVSAEEVEWSIAKGIAGAHEIYRRAARGELLYAQSLLDEWRGHIIKADDWLNGRTPASAVQAKVEQRCAPAVLEVLAASYCRHEQATIQASLALLLALYREQVTALHERFTLSRPLAQDLEALAIVA